MGDLDRNTESDGYRPPDPIGLPPIFAWPVRPIKSVKWLLVEFLFPWSFIFVGLAIVSWNFLTPEIIIGTVECLSGRQKLFSLK